MVDDQAFHPVLARGQVYFGSSGDDHLYCLSASNGVPKWRFAAEGPIRFAPFLVGDRAFFGSDDGYFYCLDAGSGALIWRRRLGSEERWMIGNGRLISAWPIRTGCVASEGRVYVAAGLFPQQGCWAYALEQENGDLVWRSPLKVSPQGYLLSSPSHLFIPTGRGLPVALDRETGTKQTQIETMGGSFAVLDDALYVGGTGNDRSLGIARSDTGARLLSVKGGHLVVGPKYSAFLDGPLVITLDRDRFRKGLQARIHWENALKALPNPSLLKEASTQVRKALRQRRAEAAEALREAEDEMASARREIATVPKGRALITGPETLVVGHERGIVALELESGTRRWSVELPEAVLGLAMADQFLVATTVSGRVHGFSAESGKEISDSPAGGLLPPSPDQPEPDETLRAALDSLPVTRGFAVLLGEPASRWQTWISETTELQVILGLADENPIQWHRKRLLARGRHGAGVSVHHFDHHDSMVGEFAVLVIHDGRPQWHQTAMRIARPHGGIVVNLKDGTLKRRGPLAGAGRWTHMYGDLGNTCRSGDEMVHSDLQLQWFGGVGPRRMVDRHLRGSPPLYDGGILVVPGENSLIGVDAFTGTELWHLDAPGSQRYSMPFDAGYMAMSHDTVALAVEDECWMIDSHRGNIKRRIPLPEARPGHHWGYVGFDGMRLIGTLQSAQASRRRPGREQVDSDYRNGQPLVASETLFVADPLTGKPRWVFDQGSILNPTLTSSKDAIYGIVLGEAWKERGGASRVTLSEASLAGGRVVRVDSRSGEVSWQVPLPESLKRCRNIIYLCHSGGNLVGVGSWLNEMMDTTYEVVCFESETGQIRWQAQHDKGKPGETFHGEQMHHPVLLEEVLVTEPVAYNLATGEPIRGGDAEPWRLVRPGHSCGTISAAKDTLFFRAGNPTALDLRAHWEGRALPRALSPTRPGCWINMIPAGGMVLIPEASSGCVCNFSLQTSMAFRPR